MTRVIAVANLKGGTGKSTAVANLACAWGREPAPMRVLAIDLDPQGDLTAMFGRYPDEAAGTVDDLFVDEDVTVEQARMSDVAPQVDLIVAGPKLASIELGLAGQMSSEFFLKDALDGHIGGYDIVLIDCPPQLGKLTPNALFAATEVVIPVSMVDRGAYSGAVELLARVEEVRRRQPLEVTAIVRTHVDRRRRAFKALNGEIESLGAPVAKTLIPLRSAFNDAGVVGSPVSLLEPDSEGGMAYRRLGQELGGLRAVREAA
jgi:chromosome partitioning protein